MSTPILYTPSDVAEALSVTPMTVNNWQKRFSDCPAPAFVRTSGAPLWDSLEGWSEWNEKRLVIVEAENKVKAEARLAKAKAEYEKAMAAMGEG